MFTLIIAPNGFISRENEAYGMSTEWFLGARNLFIIWFLPALLIAALYREKTKNNFRFFSLIAAIIVSIAIQGSGTTMVGVAVFLLLYFFPAIKKFLTPTNIAIVVAFLVVTIVINNSFEYLRPIVEGVLKRKKWRRLNSHNFTNPQNDFNFDLVSVGKGTYGGIYVLTFDDKHKLKIGNYCSIIKPYIGKSTDLDKCPIKKNVFVFWWDGFENASNIVQKCLQSVRKAFDGCTI